VKVVDSAPNSGPGSETRAVTSAPEPGVIDTAVYGLPELYRDQIAQRIRANTVLPDRGDSWP